MTGEHYETIQKLAGDVMTLARNTLVVNLRFLDAAISRLEVVPGEGTFSVDGRVLTYDPVHVLRCYREERNAVPRAYLHMLFHCIFQHFDAAGVADKKAWDLACDISAEAMINELGLSGLQVERQTAQEMECAKIKDEISLLTAEKLYRFFADGGRSEEEMEGLSLLFHADNHMLWFPEMKQPKEQMEDLEDAPEDSKAGASSEEIGAGAPNQEELLEDWKDISEQIQMDLETFSKGQGDNSGTLMQNLKELNRERYNYEEFLKKFTVMGESLRLNDDEFDYIFYTYGLNMYGKMPLIEPLEYKEVKKIREFVIAIDTSGSCSGETVQRFIEKTYNILTQQENFFTKINVHIIQCDNEIKEDVTITSREEFEEYMETMEIQGLGGTDFRPVFEHVDQLIRDKAFTNLKGLIYFTDGWGEFPRRQPDYDAAFVFLDDDYNNYDVPVWAIKLILQTEDI